MNASAPRPLLGPTDPVPPASRVLVAGASGAGKTTLAAALAQRWGLTHHEIDALHHGPNWTPRPTFAQEVHAFAAADGWVTEWQYTAVRPLLASRADLLVWLDLPRSTVMHQVTRRTLHRRLRRIELWNGNVEGPLRHILTDPEHIIRWAWRTHGLLADRIATVRETHPDLPVVRLCSRREVHTWLHGPASEGFRDGSVDPQRRP